MQVYSVPQLAKITGVAVGTMTKWIRSGDMVHFMTWFIGEDGRTRVVMRGSKPTDVPHPEIPYAYIWSEDVLLEKDSEDENR